MRITGDEAGAIFGEAIKHLEKNQSIKNLSPSQRKALNKIIDKVEQAKGGIIKDFDVKISEEGMRNMEANLKARPTQGKQSFFIVRFFSGLMNALHLRTSSQSIVDKMTFFLREQAIEAINSISTNEARGKGKEATKFDINSDYSKSLLVSILQGVSKEKGSSYLRGIIEAVKEREGKEDPLFIDNCLKLIHKEFSNDPEKKYFLFRGVYDTITSLDFFWTLKSGKKTEIDSDPELKEAILDFCEYCVFEGLRSSFSSLTPTINNGKEFVIEIRERGDILNKLKPPEKTRLDDLLR